MVEQERFHIIPHSVGQLFHISSNLQKSMRKTSPKMNQSEYVVIQEGESVECSGEKQKLFEPCNTIQIGGGGYSAVYKEVIPAGHFRYKTESNSPNTLNQVSSSCFNPSFVFVTTPPTI